MEYDFNALMDLQESLGKGKYKGNHILIMPENKMLELVLNDKVQRGYAKGLYNRK